MRSSSPVLPTILSHCIELPWVSKSSSHIYRGALASLVTALLGRRAALNFGSVGHVRGLGLGSPAPSCLRSCSVCCLGPVGFIAKVAPTDHLSRLSTPFGRQCREPALGVGWVLVCMGRLGVVPRRWLADARTPSHTHEAVRHTGHRPTKFPSADLLLDSSGAVRRGVASGMHGGRGLAGAATAGPITNCALAPTHTAS